MKNPRIPPIAALRKACGLCHWLALGLAVLAVGTLGCQRTHFETHIWSETAPEDSPSTASPRVTAWAKDPDFVERTTEIHIGSETVYRKVQRVADLQVEGGAMTEILQRNPIGHQAPNRRVFLAQRKLHTALPLISRAELMLYRASQDRIQSIYLRSLKEQGMRADGGARLIITERNGHFSPELKVDVSDPKTGEFYVDSYALTGERIDRRPVGARFQTPAHLAQVFPMGPKKSHLAWVPVFWRQTRPSLSGTYFSLTSQAGLTLNGDEARVAYALDDPRFDQVQVYYFVETFLNLLKTRHGFELPVALQVETHIGYPDSSSAAFYYQNKLRFGTGDGKTYQNMMRDPTIVVHEVGHAVIDAITQLPVQGEGGSINEGVADFLAASTLDTPKMGEDSFIGGPYRRNLDNQIYFDQIQGKTYADSEIVSGFFWQLRKLWGAEKSEEFSLRVLARLLPDADLRSLRAQIQELGATYPEESRAQLNQVLNERKWQ